MKVYLVEEVTPYEGSDTVSIHSTLPGAKRAALKAWTGLRQGTAPAWNRYSPTVWSLEPSHRFATRIVISKLDLLT